MSEFEAGKTVHYHLAWGKGKDSKTYIKLATEQHYAVQLEPEGPECKESGCVHDIIGNWDTTEAIALEGGKLVTVDPANQERVDVVMAQYRDCFGK